MSAKKPSLPFRWKRQPSERGLARVCQGERGWELWNKSNRVASVYVLYAGWSRKKAGYYAVVSDDSLRIPLVNTCGAPASTVSEAMDAAELHVFEALNAAYTVKFNRSAYTRTLPKEATP